MQKVDTAVLLKNILGYAVAVVVFCLTAFLFDYLSIGRESSVVYLNRGVLETVRRITQIFAVGGISAYVSYFFCDFLSVRDRRRRKPAVILLGLSYMIYTLLPDLLAIGEQLLFLAVFGHFLTRILLFVIGLFIFIDGFPNRGEAAKG